MLSALLLSMTIATPQWDATSTVPGYQLAFTPSAITGAKLSGVKVSDTVVRGIRTIESWWVIRQPISKVIRELTKQMQPEIPLADLSDEGLQRRGSVIAWRALPDRMLKAFAIGGRPVTRKDGNSTVHEYQDKETYTVVQLTEQPLRVGPLPKAWPTGAFVNVAMPKSFPGLPVKGLSREPDAWSKSMTPSGAMQYWMQWYVHEPGKSFFPRLIADLDKSHQWKVGSAEPSGSSRSWPVQPSTFVWLDLEHSRLGMPEIPSDWSVFGVSWVDPTSILRSGK